MNLNSKLTDFKREMDHLGKQLSTQHTSILRTLNELKMQEAKPVGEPDDGSGSGEWIVEFGSMGKKSSYTYLGNHCLKHC